MVEKRELTNAQKLKVGKIFLFLAASYVIIVVSLYFLMGSQLHYRDSRENIPMPTAEMGTTELTSNVEVEQTFSTKIIRLFSVSVQWGTYYRTNSGTVTMRLYNDRTGALLMEDSFDASAIQENGITTLAVETPFEDLWGEKLRLSLTADSPAGQGVSPLMFSTPREDGTLTVNGTAMGGTLCFSASGEEKIWTGLYYWYLAAGLGAVIATCLVVSYRKWKKGRNGILVNVVLNMRRYRFLIKQLVNRDFKIKYKRSVLGVLWSFLNPLLTMAVQYVVFSNLFRFSIPHYPTYLLCGGVLFNFFTESCGLTLNSIVGNASLITKVYMPKYIYPLTRTMSSAVNLLISMIPLLLVSLLTGLFPTKAYLLIVWPLLCMVILALGMGMLLAAAMVFFRDVQFLWGIFSMIWMYLTPIFYPADALPAQVAWVLKANPIYYSISFLRTCIIDGISPEPRIYIASFMMAAAVLFLGVFVFKKTQDKFVLYL